MPLVIWRGHDSKENDMSELIFQTAKPWLVVRFLGTSLTDPNMIERAKLELTDRLNPLALRPMVLMNFRGIEFVSSQVIGLLLHARGLVNAKSGTLVLCRVSPKIREALLITGLEEQFTIEESETAVVGKRRTPRRPLALSELGWLD